MVKALRAEDGFAIAALAWLSRIATFVLLIYMTALDAIGGFGLGRTIMVTQGMVAGGELSPEQLTGVVKLLDTMWVDPWVGGEVSFTSQTASWAAFVAALFAALALFLGKRAPAIPLAALVAFGWYLQVSHAALHGPIAFALLVFAAAWIWFRGGESAPRWY